MYYACVDPVRKMREITWTIKAQGMKYFLMAVFLFTCVRSYKVFKDYTVGTNDECEAFDTEKLTEYVEEFRNNSCIATSITSCCLLLVARVKQSGVYKVEDTNVFCDADSGWMTFMKRSRNLNKKKFSQSWKRYSRQKGFGSLHEDHWIGLNLLQKLTQSYDMELRIDLWNTKTQVANVTLIYDAFHVSGPEEDYKLTLGTFYGPVFLNGFNDHNNTKFSTPDHEPPELQHNCAKVYGGGWWYTDCYSFLPTSTETPLLGRGFTDFNSVEMKIRPQNCYQV